MMRQIFILAIPIITGLSAAMWSRLVKESFVLVPLVTCAYSAILVVVLLAYGHSFPRRLGMGGSSLIVYMASSIVVVWLWMAVAKNESGETDATPVALAEIAWPVFTAAFMWALYGVWSLTGWQIVGASISVIGLLIVALSS